MSEQVNMFTGMPLFIFISYAHKDGRDLALRLKSDLEIHGYTVWLDAIEIKGGENWSVQIERAIDQAQITLALLSHGSYLSDICRAEQLRSLRKGKRVIPLLVQEGVERPLALEHLNYRDFTDKRVYGNIFQTLLDDLKRKDSTPTSFLMRRGYTGTTSLPKTFIPRDDVLLPLRDKLLSDNTDRQIALTALRGLGGLGKSIMALALCYDETIQDAFPDGVLWVEVGKQPRNGVVGVINQVFTGLSQRLTDSDDGAATMRLHELLSQKSVFIVLDDVWDEKYVKPFLFPAPRCRVLITTRGIGTASLREEYGIMEHHIGMMTPDQAIALIVAHSSTPNDAVIGQIAAKVGYLPLALKIVGARLNSKNNVRKLSGADWMREYVGVSKIRETGTTKQGRDNSLSICIDLSADEIGDRQPLYHALGIFAKNASIPVTAVIMLWRILIPTLNVDDCDDLILLLERLALIDRNAENNTITLHDLLHDYNHEKLEIAGKFQYLGRALLDTYFLTGTGKGWHTVPDDGYLYDHLVYHLDALNAGHEISTLFDTHDWMQARIVAAGYINQGFIADLITAWKKYAHPENFARCYHYALIRTSFNSLASSHQPELIIEAVKSGVPRWTVARALSIAINVPDANQRAKFLTLLLQIEGLSNDQQELAAKEGLAAINAISREDERYNALVDLGRVLPDIYGGDLLTAALMGDDWYRSRTLSGIFPILSDTLKTQIFQIGKIIKDEWSRAYFLTIIAKDVPDYLKDEILTLVRGIKNKSSRIKILANIVSRFTADAQTQIMNEIFSLARGLSDEEYSGLIKLLASTCPDTYKGRFIRRLRTFKDDMRCAEAIAKLIPFLPDKLKLQVLPIIQKIKDKRYYTSALAAVIVLLPEQYKQDVVPSVLSSALGIIAEEEEATFLRNLIESTQQIDFELSRFEELSNLTQNLPTGIKSEVVKATISIGNPVSRAEALIALIPILPEKLRRKAQTTAFSSALSINDKRACVGTLLMLATKTTGKLQEATLAKALELAYTIENRDQRLFSISILIPYLPESIKESETQYVVQEMRHIKNYWHIQWHIILLLPTFSNTFRIRIIEDVLKTILVIEDDYIWREALTHLESDSIASPVKEVTASNSGNGITLVNIPTIKDERERAWAFWRLSPSLIFSDDQMVDALTIAHSIKNEEYRSDALAAFSAHLPNNLKNKLLTEAQKIKSDEYRSRILRSLIPDLSEELTDQALTMARAMNDQWSCSLTLVTIAQSASGPNKENLFSEALAVIKKIWPEEHRSRAFYWLVPDLPELLKEEALIAAREIGNPVARASALMNLVPILSEPARSKILQEIFDIVPLLDEESGRSHLIAQLIESTTPDHSLNQQIRIFIAKQLLLKMIGKREDVLRFISWHYKSAFSSLLVADEVSTIKKSIIEICSNWRWV